MYAFRQFRFSSSSSTSTSTKTTKTVVELFYDIISPYSYIQFELLTRQKQQWNSMALRFTPASLGGVLRNAQNPAPVLVPAKVNMLIKDMKRLSDFYKIPYETYPNFPEFAFKKGSLATQRFLLAIKPNISEQQNENLDVIRKIALETGVPKTTIERAIESIGNESIKAKLIENTQKVTDFGGFGLPTTVLHFANQSEAVFGCDRLQIIGHLLGESKPPVRY